MIELSRICKSYSLPRGNRKDVLRDASIIFRPGVNMGILGLNGQGKSTLIRIISGSELPDSGTIKRKGRVSWPIGFTGGFNGSLTGRENLRFTCRIYGADIREVTNFVETFTELGPYMDMPVKTYSSGMRSKLAFGLSMAIGFDFYLIDEAWSVGDASFQAKAEKVFKERKARSTLIVVSHSVATIRKNCDSAAVLHDGMTSWMTLCASIWGFAMPDSKIGMPTTPLKTETKGVPPSAQTKQEAEVKTVLPVVPEKPISETKPTPQAQKTPQVDAKTSKTVHSVQSEVKNGGIESAEKNPGSSGRSDTPQDTSSNLPQAEPSGRNTLQPLPRLELIVHPVSTALDKMRA